MTKVYKFFQLPKKDAVVPKEYRYTLYAYTNDKKLRKEFRKMRDMKLFAEITVEMEDDEYVKYANTNRGKMLSVYPYDYKIKYPNRGEELTLGTVEILSTWYEKTTTEDFSESADLRELELACSMCPFIFNKKYRRALYDLQFVAFWKVLAHNVEDRYQFLNIEDRERMQEDYNGPMVTYDELSIFISLYGDTFSVSL